MGKQYIELADNFVAITSKEELSAAHAAIARSYDTKQQIQLATKKKIQELQEQAEKQVATLNEQIATEFSRVYAYAQLHKTDIVTDKAKSIATPSGRIGWQKEKAHIEVTEDEADVIETIKKLLKENASSFIVTKERLDLPAILSNFGQLDGIKGLVHKEGDDVFYLSITDARFEVLSSTSSERFVVKT